MRSTSRTSRTSHGSQSTALWFKGLAICSLALFGHVVVRFLITDILEGRLPLFARPTPGSLTVSVQAPPEYTDQVLQTIYHQTLIASYYVTTVVLGLGLVVLLTGLLLDSQRR